MAASIGPARPAPSHEGDSDKLTECRILEDYAPAYCVDYTGFAQQGGDLSDAQRSLCVNWERIQCGPRRSLDEAMPAIKATWDRRALSPNGRLTGTVTTSMVA